MTKKGEIKKAEEKEGGSEAVGEGGPLFIGRHDNVMAVRMLVRPERGFGDLNERGDRLIGRRGNLLGEGRTSLNDKAAEVESPNSRAAERKNGKKKKDRGKKKRRTN